MLRKFNISQEHLRYSMIYAKRKVLID